MSSSVNEMIDKRVSFLLDCDSSFDPRQDEVAAIMLLDIMGLSVADFGSSRCWALDEIITRYDERIKERSEHYENAA